MFSGPWGIVVVRVSWLGHPTLIKKKRKKKKEEARTTFSYDTNKEKSSLVN
jgi:lipid A disaccharide synthetase